MKIDETNKRQRDDKVHNCDLIIRTRLNIVENQYKHYKKELEEKLLQAKLIDSGLRRYSTNNNFISCLLVHRITNFNLRGWKSDMNTSYSFKGVVSDCIGLIKNTIWKDRKDLLLAHQSVSSSIEDREHFTRQLNIFNRLQEFVGNPVREDVNIFLPLANEIIQTVCIIPKGYELTLPAPIGYSRDYQRLYASSYNDEYINLGNSIKNTKNNPLVSYVDFSKFDEQFGISTAFNKLDEERSNSEDIHIKLNLNKEFDVSLTTKSNETKEDIFERAKEIVSKKLNNSFLKDTFKNENFSVLNSNLIKSEES